MDGLSRKLQKTNKDQYILTIPKSLIQLLQWKERDIIVFGIDKGKITVMKDSPIIKRGK